MNLTTEIRTLAEGVVQRQREAALRRARARRQLKRKQRVRTVMRVGAGTAAVSAAGLGVAKGLASLGGTDQVRRFTTNKPNRWKSGGAWTDSASE